MKIEADLEHWARKIPFNTFYLWFHSSGRWVIIWSFSVRFPLVYDASVSFRHIKNALRLKLKIACRTAWDLVLTLFDFSSCMKLTSSDEFAKLISTVLKPAEKNKIKEGTKGRQLR